MITPSSAGTPQGQTQQFTANSPVTWAASCGSITASGLFTASATQGSACKITATASTGTAYTANAVDTVGAAPTLTIAPLSPTINEGAQQQFTANVAATWTSSCGTIGASSGMYTAPLAPGSCTITATANDGSGHKASTPATIPLALDDYAGNRDNRPGPDTTVHGQRRSHLGGFVRKHQCERLIHGVGDTG